MASDPQFKIVTCPDCGADLQNVPRTSHAVCPACSSTKTFPRFTEPERTQAKRAALPEATRLKCQDTWWRIAGQPGIWSAKFTKDYPGAIRARFNTSDRTHESWAVGWFGRLSSVEDELREVLHELDDMR